MRPFERVVLRNIVARVYDNESLKRGIANIFLKCGTIHSRTLVRRISRTRFLEIVVVLSYCRISNPRFRIRVVCANGFR